MDLPSNMSWVFEWNWHEMCGPDGLVIWSDSTQDWGLCFQDLCLKVPILALLALVSAFYCGRQDRWVVRDRAALHALFARAVITLLLAIQPIVRVCYNVSDAPGSMHPVHYLLYGVESFAWLVHFGYILTLRHRLGLSPRGPIVVCVLWTWNFIFTAVSLRSYAKLVRGGAANQAVYNQFYAEIASFVIQVLYVMTLFNGKAGAHAAFSRQYRQFQQYHRTLGNSVQNDERQGLLNTPRIGQWYSGFREERDPGYLGVAMDDTTFSSRLLFHWVKPLLVKGIEGQLGCVDDLFDLPEDLTPSHVYHQLETAMGQRWDHYSERASVNSGPIGSTHTSTDTLNTLPPSSEHTPIAEVTQPVSLVRALHRCFGWEFYSIGILKLITDCSGFVSPLLLNRLVTFIESKSEAKEDGYVFAAGLTVASLVAALCNSHFNFCMAKVGVKIRSAIVTLIYRKTLTLSTKSLSHFSVGEIVNFMSTDTDRIVNSCPSFHAFWSIPFQLAVTLYLLYLQVGLAFLAGLVFAIVLIPINKLIALKIGTLSTKMMEQKDERVKVTTEALRGIHTLKMHVWEEYFLSKILRIRDRELYYLKGRKYLDALCVFFWATTPVIIALLTFTTYVLLQGDLTAARVFTTIALLNMLISPLNAFPWVLNGLIEAWVSVSRIQKLLSLPDLDMRGYYHPLPVHDSEVSFLIREGSFEWGADVPAPSRFQLQDINITVLKGQLVGVVGEVGSGKSSLLAAILAELEKVSGVVGMMNPEQGVAFVSQQPWLQRGTIRDNILFGKPFDQTRYNIVLQACCLVNDLRSLKNGDLSGVSEGASNLSGGQKARIALARAVYQDKAVYVFDDILSAVDPPVANHIFHNCILKHLRGRTRVLCTHQVQVLRFADVVLRVNGGRIVQSGVPSEVLAEEFENLTLSDMEVSQMTSGKQQLLQPSTDELLSMSGDGVLSNEHREVGTVQLKVYAAYWKATGSALVISILLSLVLMQTSRNLSDWWMSYWVSHNVSSPVGLSVNEGNSVEEASPFERKDVIFYLIVYGSIAAANSLFTLLRAFLFAYAGIYSATGIHKQLISTIIKAKMIFFDLSPLGRIINRLSSDTYTIDDSLPFILNIFLAQLFGLIGAMVVTVYGLPWIGLVLVPLIPIYHWLQEQYRQASRELKRLSSTTLSPVYSHFSESLQGLSTIRAFRAYHRFRHDNENLLESNQKAVLASQAAAQWLGLRLQLIGVAMITGVGMIAVLQHQFDVANAGVVGLAVAYALSVTGMLSGVLNAFTETEREMVAVERAQQYITRVECEPCSGSQSVPYGWPSQGVVTFHNVILKYRENLTPSLKHVSFETYPLEKIGVVGRTGAGKSSLLAALFRLVEISNGCILIDSVNIATISLRCLRSQLEVIPQEPFLFSGTVRDNIDPLKKYHDNEIYDALNQCSILNVVRHMGGLQAEVGVDGSLFSAGQKQLICLARAILHNAKILCIDEATANVDQETDRKIQKTIRSSFRQSTVITIAHRIGTVMDSDRVLVMGDGEVLEYDTPAKLLEDKNSHFYKLVHGNEDEN